MTRFDFLVLRVNLLVLSQLTTFFKSLLITDLSDVKLLTA